MESPTAMSSAQLEAALTVSANLRPETPLHEDPVLGMTMLPSNGEHGNAMQVFIQEHLTTILQPLAETIQELKYAVKICKDDSALANSIAERNLESIATHEQKIVLFGGALERVTNDIKDQRVEVQEAVDEFVKIEVEIDNTKVSVAKTEGYLQSCITSSAEVRRMIDDVDSRLRQVQLSVSETNVHHMAFEDRICEIRNTYDGLNERHMQMMSTLQQYRQSDENTRSVVKRSVATADKHKKDSQRSFTLLDDRLKSAEAMLLDTSHSTQRNSKQLKQLSSDVKQVTGEMGEVVGAQEMAAAQQHKTVEPARQTIEQKVAAAQDANPQGGGSAGMGNRMGQLEQGILLLNRSQEHEKKTLDLKCKEMDDLIKKTIVDVRDLAPVIEHTAKAITLLEDKVLRNESKVAQVESGFDPVVKKCEKVEQDIRGFPAQLRELAAVIDMRKHDKEMTDAGIANVNKDIAGVHTAMRTIAKDQVEYAGSLTKITMRIELAHEYMQGMSKGFQDTHRRVAAGLDGMHPPKTVQQRKTLPEIPGSVASRGGGASPPPKLPPVEDTQ